MTTDNFENDWIGNLPNHDWEDYILSISLCGVDPVTGEEWIEIPF